RGLKLPMERFMVNVNKYGNTSTASIPIATCEAFESGRLQRGDDIVFVGFGAGLTWGSMAAQWTGPLQEREGRLWLRRYKKLTRIRSFFRRLRRRIEGLIWGHNRTA
ncbi:MAG: hypothetical protein OEZ02_11575, partial [Anaerolineae bacterium]|nr:hypothetical protein [Anaerolineae bacterium]